MDQLDTVRTAPSRQEILQAVCGELNKMNPNGIALSENTDITTDLNMDSVAVMDLLFALEEQYDISIPLNELGEVRTIGQLTTVVEQLVNKS